MSALALPLDVDLPGEGHPYYVLDVFTDTPLEGNQLGVFTDGRPFSTSRCRDRPRAELSETIFRPPAREWRRRSHPDLHARAELPFAGHPILGRPSSSASALGLRRGAPRDGEGPVPLRLERTAGRGRVRLDGRSPRSPLRARTTAARSCSPRSASRSRSPGRGLRERPASRLRPASPTRTRSPRCGPTRPRSPATSASAPTASPARARSGSCGCSARHSAIAEDPATGSAAGPLAVHLGRHGVVPFGHRDRDPPRRRDQAAVDPPRPRPAADEGPEVGGTAVVVARATTGSS